MKNNKRGAGDIEEQTGGAAGPDPANEPKEKKQKLSKKEKKAKTMENRSRRRYEFRILQREVL
jgi:hypothetical protein